MTAQPNTPSRIGIDASWACGNMTGTGVHTRNMVTALIHDKPSYDYHLYFRNCCHTNNELFSTKVPHTTCYTCDAPSTAIRSTVLLAHHLQKNPVDVFLSSTCFLPLWGCKQRVATILDMNVFKLGRHWLRPGRWHQYLTMRVLTPLSLKQATRIITVSEATRKDITTRFPNIAHKVNVIYCAVDFARLDDASNMPRKKMPTNQSPYFLYVGVMSPTKNLDRLIHAFSQLPTPINNRDFQLILAGRDCGTYMVNHLKPLIARLGLNDRVLWKGFVNDTELVSLYRNAHALVQPSLMEGFGYPIVEGMYLGTPVITSNTTSCPEIAGDAALCVNPESEEDINRALYRLATDPALCATLIERGHKRAARFSMESVAAKYTTLIDSLLADDRS